MITKIKIENFKSIDSLELELGRLNVFIGANGSGKSNILEGIAFGSAAIEDKLDREFLPNRGIRYANPNLFFSGFDTKSENDTIKIDYSFDKEAPISFELKYVNGNKSRWVTKIDSRIKEEMSNLLGSFSTKGKSDITLLKMYKLLEKRFESSAEIDNFFTAIHRDELLKEHAYDKIGKFLIFAPENYFLRNLAEEGVITPLGIRGEGLFEHLVSLFKGKNDRFKQITERLESIEWFESLEIPQDLILGERRLVFKDSNLKEGLHSIDQRSVNEGILYLLFYLTLFVSDETPQFFAIDNIDNAMNPLLGSALVKDLGNLAKTHEKQAILTTHNPSVLDGLDLRDDDQRLFVVSRNKSGHTKVKRILHKDSEVRLSESFIRGYIGGLPKNF
jgi:predicted ATPase